MGQLRPYLGKDPQGGLCHGPPWGMDQPHGRYPQGSHPPGGWDKKSLRAPITQSYGMAPESFPQHGWGYLSSGAHRQVVLYTPHMGWTLVQPPLAVPGASVFWKHRSQPKYLPRPTFTPRSNPDPLGTIVPIEGSKPILLHAFLWCEGDDAVGSGVPKVLQPRVIMQGQLCLLTSPAQGCLLLAVTPITGP